MSHSDHENEDQNESNVTPIDASGDNAGGAEDAETESVEAKLAAMEEELAQYKDRYMRAVAETENLRRRSEKERMDLLKYGLEGTFKDLLPVLDGFELAVSSDQPESAVNQNEKSFYSGILLVKKQLLDTLRKHGLEQLDAKNQPFDPNFHQAIQRVESAEHKEETVAGEFQKGYVLNGRLIRPAMVSVFIPV